MNDYKPEWVLEKVKAKIAEFLLDNPTKQALGISIACYGLAFKPDIDDLRESPALNIALEIDKLNIKNLYLVEPNIETCPAKFSSKAELVRDEFANESADIHVILVAHSQFKNGKETYEMKKYLIDTVGLLM